MHNSPLKCATNDASTASPQKYDSSKHVQSYASLAVDKASPTKQSAASQISPEKRSRENV